MNRFLAELMDKPSYRPRHCAICGVPRPRTNHHIVPRSQGGTDGPTISLCGHGTAGCHGKAEENRLHFRWREGWWWYLETTEPTKYERALERDGWRRVPWPGEAA